jgi:REP element-mobilizing transposase RayT
MSKKLTYEYVKSYIESFNYVLLSLEYKNTHSKLLVRCPEGHEYYVTFKNFKQGQRRCPVCKGGIKLTYSYVKSYIESFGYTLLSDTYKNALSKLLIRCPEGHEYKVKFNKFQQGRRCFTCSHNKQALTYEYVKSYIESFGYTLLSDTYVNDHSKLLVRCPEGHEYKARFSKFKMGRRCPVCSGKQKHTYKYVKEYIESFDYILLSTTYVNAKTKLRVRCFKGHEYEVTFNNFQRGCRCPFCSNNTSKGEIEVQDFIESLGYDIVRNDRTKIINILTGHNLELDVWIPSLNKAVEYNGTYWHSMFERKKCDDIKKDQCRQKNIDLLVIKDNNWINNREYEKRKITEWLNKRA